MLKAKAAAIKIYVANLGAYNRGYLVGKWIELPLSEEEIKEELDEILNGEEAAKTRSYPGEVDEEWAIHDYECDFLKIGEYDSIERLNNLAARLEEVESYEENKLKALLECGYYGDDIEECIDNLDNFRLSEDIQNDQDLGQYWLFESGCYEVPEFLMSYIDEKAFGRDISINSEGMFTEYGWIERC